MLAPHLCTSKLGESNLRAVAHLGGLTAEMRLPTPPVAYLGESYCGNGGLPTPSAFWCCPAAHRAHSRSLIPMNTEESFASKDTCTTSETPSWSPIPSSTPILNSLSLSRSQSPPEDHSTQGEIEFTRQEKKKYPQTKACLCHSETLFPSIKKTKSYLGKSGKAPRSGKGESLVHPTRECESRWRLSEGRERVSPQPAEKSEPRCAAAQWILILADSRRRLPATGSPSPLPIQGRDDRGPWLQHPLSSRAGPPAQLWDEPKLLGNGTRQL